MKTEFYALRSCSKRWTHMNLMSFNLWKIKACSFNSLIVTKGKNSLRASKWKLPGLRWNIRWNYFNLFIRHQNVVTYNFWQVARKNKVLCQRAVKYWTVSMMTNFNLSTRFSNILNLGGHLGQHKTCTFTDGVFFFCRINVRFVFAYGL